MAKKPSTGKGGARKTASKDLETRLIEAMLELAAQDGWQGVTLPAIAEGAGARLSELYPAWRSRMAILVAFMRRVDRAVIETDFARDRTLDVRETPAFLEVAHRVREGLRAGHSYDD